MKAFKHRIKQLLVLCRCAIIGVSTIAPHTYRAQSEIKLSDNEQWIEGLSYDYEYITDDIYNKYSNLNNLLNTSKSSYSNSLGATRSWWTSLKQVNNSRPDNTSYTMPKLIEDSKLEVLSAWYGQTIHFRKIGESGPGVTVKIPEYAALKEQYKKSVRIMHILTPETYQENFPGFYKSGLRGLQDKNGYLTQYTTHNDINITVQTHFIEDFNQSAKSYMTDAEGTYIYDLVAIGGFANTGADLSLYATEVLKDYIGQGYGFLIG